MWSLSKSWLVKSWLVCADSQTLFKPNTLPRLTQQPLRPCSCFNPCYSPGMRGIRVLHEQDPDRVGVVGQVVGISWALPWGKLCHESPACASVPSMRYLVAPQRKFTCMCSVYVPPCSFLFTLTCVFLVIYVLSLLLSCQFLFLACVLIKLSHLSSVLDLSVFIPLCVSVFLKCILLKISMLLSTTLPSPLCIVFQCLCFAHFLSL